MYRNPLLNPPDSYVYTFLCLTNTIHKVLKNRKCQTVALRVLHTKALQALTESSEKWDENSVNATNFHRSHANHISPFSPQTNDQAHTDSLVNPLLLDVVKHDHSLIISNDQEDTDVVKKSKLLASSLQMSLIIFPVLKSLRNKNYQQVTENLATLKNFWTNVQGSSRNMLHGSLTMLMNSPIRARIHWMLTMHTLTILHIKLKLIQAEILLKYRQKIFMIPIQPHSMIPRPLCLS